MNKTKTRLLAFALILVTLIGVSSIALAKNLRKGDTGSAVRKLQVALNNYGYSCVIDGEYTSNTVKAVKSYQKDWDLSATGVANKATQIGLLGGSYSYGDVGPKIEEFQKKLKKAGYSVTVDGIYGESTVSAVKSFQKANGLTVDGVAGSDTQEALAGGGSSSKKTTTLKYGDSGTKVEALQRALKKAGCFSSTIDGEFGSITKKAVIKYQEKYDLDADGVAGPETISSLEETTGITITGSTTEFPLKKGSKGSKVWTVTAFLKDKGYLTKAKSKFTSLVRNAVMEWQEDTGKEVTGEITEYQYKKIVQNTED